MCSVLFYCYKCILCLSMLEKYFTFIRLKLCYALIMLTNDLYIERNDYDTYKTYFDESKTNI